MRTLRDRTSITAVISLLLVAVPLATLSGCGGDSSGGTVPAPRGPPQTITVSVSGDTNPVPAGGAAHLVATVTNDASNAGVSWTISSSAGTLTNATATTVTYNAPPSPPPSDVSVTITATSKADPTVSGTYTLVFEAIAVTIHTTDNNYVGAGGTVAMTAVVVGDPSNQGVSWSISPASGAGTLSNQTPTTATYTAPVTPPASDVPVTITATSRANSANSGTLDISFSAIQVLIDPSSATLSARNTQTFTAQTAYDRSTRGVGWSLNPTSGAGTLSGVTATSVTYNAPATPPPADQQVTLTADDVAYPFSFSSVPITVRAITVSISPETALMPLGATQSFKTTVDFDPSNSGATFSLSQGAGSCTPGCGVLTPLDPPIVVYKAPASLPANPAVTFTATSVADATKHFAVPITLTAGTLQIAPDPLQFGLVTLPVKFGVSKSAPITLTNTGSAVVNISGITISGTDSSHFTQTNDCGSSLPAHASCTITVTFTLASRGTFSATLSISDNDTGSPQLVPLSGTGCKPCAPVMVARAALNVTRNIESPLPTGANTVGTRTVTMTDEARSDPYLKSDAKRELLVRFWYPTEPTISCKRAAYTAPAVWDYYAELVGVRLPKVTTSSCQDARVRSGAYPVVVFTHGYTGTFADYTFLFEDLASRGYIVASVNHTYEATATAFPDGRLVRSVFGSHLKEVLRRDEQALSFALSARMADLKFVAGQLDRLNRSATSPLAGHLDLANMAVAGHSLGGLTALKVLQLDDRFRAAITIDGVVPDSSFEPTSKPVMILDAGHDRWLSDEWELWGKLHGPHFAVNLKHAEHEAPSDAVWLERGAVKTGRMTPEQIVEATRDYIAAFLDSELRGLPVDRLLTRPSPRYPEVEVTAAGP
jgi:pimeloyl-ACP methyl ester carboxylesterase